MENKEKKFPTPGGISAILRKLLNSGQVRFEEKKMAGLIHKEMFTSRRSAKLDFAKTSKFLADIF